jgi:glycine betaine catabolism A
MDRAQIRQSFAARRPGHSLPQALYNDPAVFEFDMAAIFATSWLMAGFAAELPKSGCYVALMIGAWPVIIVRGRDDVIRAFHNTCRHRGSMLCAPGSGSVPKLVCPYHRWTYNLDGSLFSAGRMADDFAREDHGLKPIALRTVAGALFICLAETPPDFTDFAARMAAYAAPHDFAGGKVAHQSVLVENANWKLVMENARECYHCSTGHPDLAVTFPVDMSNHFDNGETEIADRFAQTMADNGLLTEPVEGDWWQLARFALNAGCTTISMDGQQVVRRLMCGVNGGDIGSMRWALDPHCFGHATGDHTFLFSAMPIGPAKTHVICTWLVHADAVEGVDYDVATLTELWTRTNLQDKALAENNQCGVNSLGYIPGPYSQEAEMLAQRFTDWYCNTAIADLDGIPGTYNAG